MVHNALQALIWKNPIRHMTVAIGLSNPRINGPSDCRLKAWSERPTQLTWFWKCSEFLNWTQLFEVRPLSVELSWALWSLLYSPPTSTAVYTSACFSRN